MAFEGTVNKNCIPGSNYDDRNFNLRLDLNSCSKKYIYPLLHWQSRFLQCSSSPASGTTPTTNHNNNMSYLPVFVHPLRVCMCVCTLDDTAEASGPPQISSVPPRCEQDDVSEPGSVFRPGAAQPASGGVLPHQQSLHRLWGAGQRVTLQKTHRSPALPASALAKWVNVFIFFLNKCFFDGISTRLLQLHKVFYSQIIYVAMRVYTSL